MSARVHDFLILTARTRRKALIVTDVTGMTEIVIQYEAASDLQSARSSRTRDLDQKVNPGDSSKMKLLPPHDDIALRFLQNVLCKIIAWCCWGVFARSVEAHPARRRELTSVKKVFCDSSREYHDRANEYQIQNIDVSTPVTCSIPPVTCAIPPVLP